MKLDVPNRIALAVTILALALGGPWLARQLATLPHAATLAARGRERVVTLEVGGMHCSACEDQVRHTLADVPGVSAVDVRLAQRRAYVVCDASLPDSSLVAAVGRAGPGFLGAVVPR